MRSHHIQILIKISTHRKEFYTQLNAVYLRSTPTWHQHSLSLFLTSTPESKPSKVDFVNLTSRSSLATSLSSLRMPSNWSITIFMWLRMRSLGLGVSEVSRAGALLRDILYRETWGQGPTGCGRGGAESGSMSLATKSLSATDPNRGPSHAGRPQHFKGTWAAKTPCLARALGTGSHSDIHAFLKMFPKTKGKSNAINPWKRKRQNIWAEAGMKLLHNHLEPTYLMCQCVCLKLFQGRFYLKHLSIHGWGFSLFPYVLRNLFYLLKTRI